VREQVEFVDRRGTASLKWDALEEIYGQRDMLGMWVADMDFRCPACVQEALRAYIDCGAYGYASLSGRFQDAFIRWERERHGYEVERDWLRYSPGVVPAINWCVASMTQPGDGVLVLPPVYFPFFHAVEDNGRRLVESRLVWGEGGFRIDFADLERKLEQARMLLFCSPHNPVGRVWRREELERVAALCESRGVLIVCDEIHQDFAYAGSRHIPMGTVTKAVTLTAPSKSFNLAGLQNGLAVIPDEALRERWDRFTKTLHLASGNSFGYLAGEAAYLHGEDWLEQVKETIYGNYQYLRASLLERWPLLRIAPLEGTYLMWTDFGAYLSQEEMKDFFEKECRLALNYGGQFRGGGESWVRWNLATSRELVQRAAEAVHSAMAARSRKP
jgi:cystathionine beta-lyase